MLYQNLKLVCVIKIILPQNCQNSAVTKIFNAFQQKEKPISSCNEQIADLLLCGVEGWEISNHQDCV